MNEERERPMVREPSLESEEVHLEEIEPNHRGVRRKIPSLEPKEAGDVARRVHHRDEGRRTVNNEENREAVKIIEMDNKARLQQTTRLDLVQLLQPVLHAKENVVS